MAGRLMRVSRCHDALQSLFGAGCVLRGTKERQAQLLEQSNIARGSQSSIIDWTASNRNKKSRSLSTVYPAEQDVSSSNEDMQQVPYTPKNLIPT